MISVDTICARLMADQTVQFTLQDRLAPFVAIQSLVHYSGGSSGEAIGAPLRTETIENILFHLRRAIEVIEAERCSPERHLSLVVGLAPCSQTKEKR